MIPDLGVIPDADGASVALWAGGAEHVDFCLLHDDGHEERIPLTQRSFGIFHDHVASIRPGMRYGFRVRGPWDPPSGARWNDSKLLVDPYARAIIGDLHLNPSIFGDNREDSAGSVPHSIVVDDHFDWQGEAPLRTPWRDTVIYEAHVRGLTMRHPQVPEHLRGTYAGLAHPAVIDHLLRLGVTAVELLPVHHFVDEIHLMRSGLTNYWGYNTLGYFAPHARYSASGSTGGQVHEFKAMVKALHGAGLEVILDVVYNHTCEGNELGPTLSLRGIDNAGYYRLREGQHYTDYTGCGNTLDITQPHVLQLVMDSLRYWVTEMHVDGFRFDLASALARSLYDVDMLGPFMSTIGQDPTLRAVKLIAEPWDVGPGGYQVGEFPALWTEWNGRYRDCVRDFWRGATGVGELGWRLTGSTDLYGTDGQRPYASINFITAHDGFTMRDLVTYEDKHNDANLEDSRDGTDDNRSRNYGTEGETDDHVINEVRHRQIRNLLATLVLSTGVPMISGGDEFGRTQHGNNNAYCQDNEISWHDWTWQDWQRELVDFTASLMHLRREHPIFRVRAREVTWLSPSGATLSDTEWNSPDTRALAMRIADSTESFLVLLNAAETDIPFTLTEPADVILDTASQHSLADNGITLAARSFVVLAPRSHPAG